MFIKHKKSINIPGEVRGHKSIVLYCILNLKI